MRQTELVVMVASEANTVRGKKKKKGNGRIQAMISEHWKLTKGR